MSCSGVEKDQGKNCSWIFYRPHDINLMRFVSKFVFDHFLFFQVRRCILLIEDREQFSTLLAKDMSDRRKRFHLGLLFSRPLFKFLEVYVLKRSFKDGLPGLIIAVSDAYAMFVQHVKLREIEADL